MRIFQFVSVYENRGALGSVDSSQNDVCRVFAAAHHQSRLGKHIGVEFVHTHIAGIDLCEE